MAKDKIAFLGGGVMGEAMIRAVLDRHVVPASHVSVTGPRRERRAELARAVEVAAVAANAAAAEHADVVTVSVRPEVVQSGMKVRRGKLRTDQVVLSAGAGGMVKALEGGVSPVSIVRTMPNTPAQV